MLRKAFVFLDASFLYKKTPASRTLAPERGRFSGHTSLARSAHPPGGFLFHRTNFPVKLKKAVWGIEYSFHRCSPYCFILLMPDRPYFPGSRIDPDHFLHGFDPVNQIVSHRKSAVFPEFVPCFIAVKYHQSASNSTIILYSPFPYLHGSSSLS